jgi:hypothetical protein
MTMLKKFRQAQDAHRTTRTSGLRTLFQLIGLSLLVASVIRELRLPPAQRTWHGQVFGKVPYDLRFPSPRRLAATMWNPAQRRVLVPTAFGVGWTVNLAALRAALPI